MCSRCAGDKYNCGKLQIFGEVLKLMEKITGFVITAKCILVLDLQVVTHSFLDIYKAHLSISLLLVLDITKDEKLSDTAIYI